MRNKGNALFPFQDSISTSTCPSYHVFADGVGLCKTVISVDFPWVDVADDASKIPDNLNIFFFSAQR
jgi:hypothetical protein